MAKLHVRHMVGGRSADVANEQVCRFEFPERPGALMAFLEELGGRWNISLFHYRNHGFFWHDGRGTRRTALVSVSGSVSLSRRYNLPDIRH